MYDGLLIDLGGTIVENKNVNFDNGVLAVYSHIQPQIDYDQFLITFQKESSILRNRDKIEIPFQAILKNVGNVLKIKYDCSIPEVEYIFAQQYEYLEKIEGIDSILNYFSKQGKSVVILSNSTFSGRTLQRQIENLGLSKYIKTIFSSADFLIRKPYREFFLQAIHMWNANEKILYIGNDYYFDMYGGSQTNLQLCWYNPYKKTNEDNIPCIDIQHYHQLLQILERK